VKLVITKGVDVANVTHLGRGVSVAQQMALLWSDPLCKVEGCNRTQRLENDHREGWAKTKTTRLDDTDRFCGHHHDLKTFKNWQLVHGKGRRPMVPPDHPHHPQSGGPPGPPGTHGPPGPPGTHGPPGPDAADPHPGDRSRQEPPDPGTLFDPGER